MEFHFQSQQSNSIHNVEELYSDLLDLCFKVPQGSHFLDDFPVWNVQNQKNPSKFLRLAAFENQKMVSTASVRLADLYVNEDRLFVAILGAVATHPDWMRKGFAKQGIIQAIEWARQQGASFIALWGSEYEFYRSLGFELCGQQVRVPLKCLPLSDVRQSTFNEGWNPAIWAMIKRRKSGLRVHEDDQKWFTAHKNVKWFWVGQPSMPKAYAALGKGIDLTGIVHEWGGDPAYLNELLFQIRQKYPETEMIGHSSLFQLYGYPFTESQMEFLCLAKVLNPHKIFKSYYPNIPFQSVLSKEGRWDITVHEMQYSSLTDGELTNLFFNSHSRSPYPIPIWFWGLDAA